MALAPHRWIKICVRQTLPLESVLAGKDTNGDPIFVGRAEHEDELLPAKVIPKKGKAYVSYNGKEYEKCCCEVLCAEFRQYEAKHPINYSSQFATSAMAMVSSNSRKLDKLFDVFITMNYQWEHATNGFVPVNAVKVGRTADGEILYIGRNNHKKSLTPGKVLPSKGCLYIPYDGKEFSFKNYEILVRN